MHVRRHNKSSLYLRTIIKPVSFCCKKPISNMVFQQFAKLIPVFALSPS